MKKRNYILLLVTMLMTLALEQGCKKDYGGPPTIPPKSSFVMNLSELDSSKTSSMKLDSVADYSNFLYAAGNVYGWNIILTVGLAVPVASFVNSFNYQGTWNNQGNCWEWKYDFTLLVTYSAKLKATVSGITVHWEMYISQQNGFQDFLWYSGDSQFDGTQGTWTLYDNPTSNTELLGIIWHNNDNDGTSDITYTNIVPGGAENGGYISYGITADTIYNAYYDIYNKGQNNLIKIKWNMTDRNGRVSDSLHFSDNDWHCWDTDYTNITCP